MRQHAIADEWWAGAYRLVDWTLALLVNRTDVHGGYYADDGRVRSTTRRGALTRDRLLVHFAAEEAAGVVGVHVTAPDGTCRTCIVDIDKHRDDDGADPGANFRFALRVNDLARTLGLSALLVDSNGAGGYHVLVVFGRSIPAEAAWRLGKYLIREYAESGLARAPESFPKAPALTGKRIGNWVRLFGRHPRRPHWSRVWGGDRWLEGAEAVAAILATGGSDADPARVVPDDFDPRAPRARPRRIRAGRGPASIPAADVGADGHDRDTAGVSAPRPAGPEVDRARAALAFLNGRFRDDYDDWLRVGMALRPLGDAGLALWHEWSAGSPKYDPSVLVAKWAGFAGDAAPGRIGLGSLFHWAKAEGWAEAARAGRPTRQVCFRIATSHAAAGEVAR